MISFDQILVSAVSYARNMELIADGKKLVLNGYIYTEHSRSGSSIHWRCVKRGRPNYCSCRLRTNIDHTNPIVDVTKHTHAGDATAVEVTKARLWMKENANRGKPAQIFAQAVRGLSAHARGR